MKFRRIDSVSSSNAKVGIDITPFPLSNLISNSEHSPSIFLNLIPASLSSVAEEMNRDEVGLVLLVSGAGIVNFTSLDTGISGALGFSGLEFGGEIGKFIFVAFGFGGSFGKFTSIDMLSGSECIDSSESEIGKLTSGAAFFSGLEAGLESGAEIGKFTPLDDGRVARRRGKETTGDELGTLGLGAL